MRELGIGFPVMDSSVIETGLLVRKEMYAMIHRSHDIVCRRSIVLSFLLLLACGSYGGERTGLPLGNRDTISFYLDSIKLSNDNIKRTEFVRKGLAYGLREGDDLALCTFRFENACLLLSQGDYLLAFDSLVRLESHVTSVLAVPSLLQQGETVCRKESGGLADSLWSNLHVDIGLGLAEAEIYLNEYTEASEIIIAVRSLYSKDSTDLVSGRCYNAMAAIMSHKGLHKQALTYYFKAVDICKSKLPLQKLMTIYCNLAICYTTLQQPEQALRYALEAYGIFRKISFYGEQYIYSVFYMGLAYAGLENYTLAEDYLLMSLKAAEEGRYDHLALYIRSNVVHFYISRNLYSQAERYARLNLAAARKNNNRVIEEASCLYLAQIYDIRGNCYSSLQYLDTAYRLSKVLAREDQEIRMGYQQRKFSNYQQEQERLQAAQNLELANSKLQNRNLWIAVILTLGLVLLGFMIFLYRRLRLQRKLNRLIRIRLEETETQSQDQIEHLQDDMRRALTDKDKELTSMALYYVKIQGLIDSLEEKLKAMKVLFGLKAKEKMYVSEMESLLHSFTPDKNWNEFELYFRRVDTDFFEKLDARFPGLTPNEKRLCALIRLNLNSKEIATMTSRTFRSVNTAKTRLKQKFGCDKDTSLYDFLADL